MAWEEDLLLCGPLSIKAAFLAVSAIINLPAITTVDLRESQSDSSAAPVCESTMGIPP